MSSLIGMTQRQMAGKPLPLDAINEALALEAPPWILRPETNTHSAYTAEFLALYHDNWEAFDRMRMTIVSKDYWLEESMHFDRLLRLINSWNRSHGRDGPKPIAPPLDVLEDLLHRAIEDDKKVMMEIEDNRARQKLRQKQKELELDRRRRIHEKARIDAALNPIASRTRSRSRIKPNDIKNKIVKPTLVKKKAGQHTSNTINTSKKSKKGA